MIYRSGILWKNRKSPKDILHMCHELKRFCATKKSVITQYKLIQMRDR